MESKESNIAHNVLGAIPMIRGMMWEKIKRFQDKMNEIEGALNHTAGNPQSDEMKKACPLKQNIEGGLYTRELFMPKGSLVIKQLVRLKQYLLKQELKEFFMYMKILNGVV